MSKTTLLKMTWFRIVDKWHKESQVHAMEEGANRSICGRQDINQVNQDSLVKFETVDNLPLKDLCGVCLRLML